MSAPAEVLARRCGASLRRLCFAAFCALALIAADAAAQDAEPPPAPAQGAVQMADALIASIEGVRPWGVGLAAGDQAPKLPPDFFDRLDQFFAQSEAEIRSQRTDSAELEMLRESLLALRSRVFEMERRAQARSDELRAQLDAAGEPPADWIEEPAELRERRERIAAEWAESQVPLLRLDAALRTINRLIEAIDDEFWRRVSRSFLERGPSPLAPATWRPGLSEAAEGVAHSSRDLRAFLTNPDHQQAIRDGLPVRLLLVALGIVLTFSLRRALLREVEAALGQPQSDRRIAWLVAVRNIARLIMPVVGAGLLFGALDPTSLVDGSGRLSLFELPGFVLAIIGAGWLGASLFSARLAAYRLLPVDDREARAGVLITNALGFVLAARLGLEATFDHWGGSAAVRATLSFPLLVIGGLLLWRADSLLEAMRERLVESDRAAGPQGPKSGASLWVLALLGHLVAAVAIAAPVAGAAGFTVMAGFVLFATILSLGLIGAGIVVFDLANRTLQAAEGGKGDGLLPVILAGALLFLGLPPLALIWGARPSDIAAFWLRLQEGVEVGGITFSAGNLFTFALVFGAVYAITQALKSLLRTSVLPRTRMDAGGRNAVLAGVGYLGFFLAAVMAISSAGVDLSNIAIIAGALSVGIGFGLQTIVSNFVSGIILLIERPIKEGDWIEVGGYMGYVRDISVRSTSIETFDRAVVILPNSDLVAGTVLNRTHRGMSGRLQIPVGVAYGSDPRHVERVLLEIIENHPLVLEDPRPVVLLMDFGDSAINFEARCWLRDVNFMLSARSAMNFEIVERFREEGIVIPFPQRDVHLVAATVPPDRETDAPGDAHPA